LVAEAGSKRDAGFFEEIENAVVEPCCLLPDGEFFKLGVFGHAVFSFQLTCVDYRLLTIGDWRLAVSLMASAYTPVLISPKGQKGAAAPRDTRFPMSLADAFAAALAEE
jgi:hypothetical protein